MLFDLVQDRTWAVLPAKFEEIDAAVIRLLEDRNASLEGIIQKEYRAGALPDDGKPYQMVAAPNGYGKYAVIPIIGTVMKRGNMFSNWSGGTSTQMVQKAFSQAVADPEVAGIILDIDSPGGACDGTKQLGDTIFAARGRKPIVAVTDGMLASAAYWIGSAADTIVSSKTSTVGSIGVVRCHYDLSKSDEQRGVKRTLIYAGSHKTVGADNAPLSKQAKDELQADVDEMYGLFVSDVARNRKVSLEKALAMADGKCFIGQSAMDAGLVDSIGYMSEAVGRVDTINRKRRTQMELAEMEKALAAAKTEIETLKTAQETAVAEKTAQVKAEADRLAAELARKTIEVQVTKLVAEGKVTPAMIAGGLVDFMSALDASTPEKIAGKETTLSAWFAENFLPSQIVKLDVHVADKDTATELSTREQEDRDARRIAAHVNPDLKTK